MDLVIALLAAAVLLSLENFLRNAIAHRAFWRNSRQGSQTVCPIRTEQQ